jgi:hypothetical protein
MRVGNLFILLIALSQVLGHCQARVKAQQIFVIGIKEQINVSSLPMNPVRKCCLIEGINKNHMVLFL